MQRKGWIRQAALVSLITIATAVGFTAGAHWESRRSAAAAPVAAARAPIAPALPPVAIAPAPALPPIAPRPLPVPPAFPPAPEFHAPEPEAVALPPFRPGQPVTLRTGSQDGVWIALTDFGWFGLLAVQAGDPNERAAQLHQLAVDGQAVRMREDYPATVRRVAPDSVQVQLGDGRLGWVSAQHVHTRP